VLKLEWHELLHTRYICLSNYIYVKSRSLHAGRAFCRMVGEHSEALQLIFDALQDTIGLQDDRCWILADFSTRKTWPDGPPDCLSLQVAVEWRSIDRSGEWISYKRRAPVIGNSQVKCSQCSLRSRTPASHAIAISKLLWWTAGLCSMWGGGALRLLQLTRFTDSRRSGCADDNYQLSRSASSTGVTDGCVCWACLHCCHKDTPTLKVVWLTQCADWLLLKDIAHSSLRAVGNW